MYSCYGCDRYLKEVVFNVLQFSLVFHVVSFYHIYQLYSRYSICIEAYFIISLLDVILGMEKNSYTLLIHATLSFVSPLNFENSNLGLNRYPLIFRGESGCSWCGQWSWSISSCGISLSGGIVLWWIELEYGLSSFETLPTNLVIV